MAVARLALALALLATAARAEEPKRLSVPMNAVDTATADATAHPLDAGHWRYVWVQDGEKETKGKLDVCLNFALSRSALPYRTVPLGNGTVARVDLRLLAPREADRKELAKVWKRMADTEPYFLVDLATTKDILAADGPVEIVSGDKVLRTLAKGERVRCDGKQQFNGHLWYSVADGGFVLAAEVELVAVELKRAIGPHCGPNGLRLHALTGSAVPVVRYEWFVRVALSTLEDGLYYEFRGIKESPDDKITDVDFFLKTFAGVTESEVRKLSVDPRNKVAMFHIKVTGKPRAVVFFSGAQSKVVTNQGLVVLTQDLFDESVEAEQDPIRNLLDAQYDGIEAFLELANGTVAYALFGGDLDGDGVFEVDGDKGEEGKLVRSAPDNLVADHTVPEPYTRRLQPAISCIRCHVRPHDGKAPEGWIPVENDVQKLVAGGLDVFGDVTDGKPKAETVDLLAGLYQGRIEKPLGRARDDLAESILRITGDAGDKKQSSTTKLHGGLSADYAAYWYTPVSAEIACRELGFDVEPTEAAKTLARLLPALPADEFGIRPEDPVLGALKAGIAVRRQQFEQVYADAATRTIETLLSEKAAQ